MDGSLQSFLHKEENRCHNRYYLYTPCTIYWWPWYAVFFLTVSIQLINTFPQLLLPGFYEKCAQIASSNCNFGALSSLKNRNEKQKKIVRFTIGFFSPKNLPRVGSPPPGICFNRLQWWGAPPAPCGHHNSSCSQFAYRLCRYFFWYFCTCVELVRSMDSGHSFCLIFSLFMTVCAERFSSFTVSCDVLLLKKCFVFYIYIYSFGGCFNPERLTREGQHQSFSTLGDLEVSAKCWTKSKRQIAQ